MQWLEFATFRFNTRTLELNNSSGELSLRPKTGELLRVFVTQPNQVLSKRDLIQAVWHSDLVADQNLFQAISELRRTLGSTKAIKTIPNRGYQWVEPVSLENSPVPSHRAASSLTWRFQTAQSTGLISVVFCALCFGAFLLGAKSNEMFERGTTVASPAQVSVSDPSGDARPEAAHVSPALAAFASGVHQFNHGEIDNAVKYFQLSATENPSFLAAKIMLAEASLRLGQPMNARKQALSIIQQPGVSADAYTLISAMDLVSRSEQQLGKNNAARDWAFEAASQAAEEGFVCTAIGLQERFDALQRDTQLGDQTLNSTAVRGSIDRGDGYDSLLSTADGHNASSQHCALLRAPVPEAMHHSRTEKTMQVALLRTTVRGFETQSV